MRLSPSQRWFVAGCLAESSLLVIAVLLGWVLNRPALATLHWQTNDFLWGLVGVLPMAAAFWWMVNSSWHPLVEIHWFLDQYVRPILGQWSPWQLLVVSVVAGISEESLFRSVIQGGLVPYLHPLGALAVASILFGLCHAMTRAYAVIAALIGAYLGGLWLLTGNLLAPVTSHAVYDFLALMYFLHYPSITAGPANGTGSPPPPPPAAT